MEVIEEVEVKNTLELQKELAELRTQVQQLMDGERRRRCGLGVAPKSKKTFKKMDQKQHKGENAENAEKRQQALRELVAELQLQFQCLLDEGKKDIGFLKNTLFSIDLVNNLKKAKVTPKKIEELVTKTLVYFSINMNVKDIGYDIPFWERVLEFLASKKHDINLNTIKRKKIEVSGAGGVAPVTGGVTPVTGGVADATGGVVDDDKSSSDDASSDDASSDDDDKSSDNSMPSTPVYEENMEENMEEPEATYGVRFRNFVPGQGRGEIYFVKDDDDAPVTGGVADVDVKIKKEPPVRNQLTRKLAQACGVSLTPVAEHFKEVIDLTYDSDYSDKSLSYK